MFGKYFTNKPDISQRTVLDMKPVLYQPNEVKTDDIFYTVYRNLEVIGGKLRYDITEIPPQKMVPPAGREFPKTFGHYHKARNPELYEVLDGRAYFLLQKYAGDPAEIEEAYIVEAGAGEKAIIPPGFGHLSINIGSDKLVLGNWIGLVEYDYETIKKFHGGCYYVLLARRLGLRSFGEGGNFNEGEDKRDSIEFEKNSNYKSVPELKKLKLRDLPELGIKNGAAHPILDLKNSPEKLDWLVNSEKYMDLLTIKKLYKEI